MLRQSPSRNGRTRGFKVKHVVQIFLLLTIFIWLLYQVRHSYYKKKEYEDPSPTLTSDGIETRGEVIKFGRKDLINLKGRQGKDEESGQDAEDVKVEEEEEEEEENTVEGRGGGDDEIDVNDQERADEEDSETEMEDLIDEEDQEKEDASPEEEVEGQSGNGKASRKVKEEDQEEAEDSTSKLVEGTQGLGGSVNGEETSNGEDSSFFRDGLIERNENSDRDARAKKSYLRSILLDDMDNKNATYRENSSKSSAG
ncbi:cilia- and flagella-associated protein 251-like [Punica granatum]|uniref:Uncharacterized protein n=2 Tax=Punica granatum TaxID=22663 RepID=A0A218X893_PUNGR|nr:cilia- and flagella-associated protein 251-like [Punica granatum]OWM80592.1 hypothetical protein CDL15_Pgr006622 [Punica granatum]PKI46951.1 hypothetical protein CRG98_032650 [Punica granatum]